MKKKKELLITLAGAAVLGGIIGAMSGCSNSYRVRTDPEIIGSFYEMGGNGSCLASANRLRLTAAEMLSTHTTVLQIASD